MVNITGIQEGDTFTIADTTRSGGINGVCKVDRVDDHHVTGVKRIFWNKGHALYFRLSDGLAYNEGTGSYGQGIYECYTIIDWSGAQPKPRSNRFKN